MKECKGVVWKGLQRVTAACAAAVFLLPSAPLLAHGPALGYQQIDLVADVPGKAMNTDSNLVNPWGLLIGKHGSLLVVDNHSDLATFYNPDGSGGDSPIHVDGGPTAAAWNSSHHDFRINIGTNSFPSRALFASEAGTILAWNPEADRSNAVVVATSSNAVYKGLALGRTHGGAFVYAADFHNGKVDVFDRAFKWVNSFTDTNVDAGFAPFNVQNLEGRLFVTFAKQHGPDNEDDEAGPGNGFVDVFDLRGHLLRRLAMHGTLNSPWGLALAPGDFARSGHALLVGNFGDGRINAFDSRSGIFLGQLQEPNGQPIQIEGLWSLNFAQRFDRHHDDDEDDDDDDLDLGNRLLYFTAGPDDETHGLLGVIVPVLKPHHHGRH